MEDNNSQPSLKKVAGHEMDIEKIISSFDSPFVEEDFLNELCSMEHSILSDALWVHVYAHMGPRDDEDLYIREIFKKLSFERKIKVVAIVRACQAKALRQTEAVPVFLSALFG